MIPGIVAAQMRAAGGGVLWTPLNMATVPQIYLDAQDSVVGGQLALRYTFGKAAK